MRHWAVCLVAIGAVLWLLNILIFYPGLMSNDSIDQLMQAQGDKPFEDWHPPLMAIVWKVLLLVSSGHVGSMLAWQLLLLWAGLVLLAVYVYRTTRRRVPSLMPFLIGLTPFVITISGVIWKDVQMAFALLLATVLILLADKAATARNRYIVLAVAGIAMIYAINMRYNALAAAMPLLWLAWRQLPDTRQKVAGKSLPVVRLGAVFAVVIISFLLVPVISLFRPVTATHPTASQMIDDMIAIYDTDEISRLAMPDKSRWALTEISGRCGATNAKASVWIACSTPEELYTLSREQYPALQKAWLKSVVSHPVRYAEYRVGQFLHFLFPRSSAEAYIWHDGMVANPYGLTFTPNLLTAGVQNYVASTNLDFGFVFRPYVWLATGVAVIMAAWRHRKAWKHAMQIIAISVSGLLYLFSYLPAVAAYDFRYSYWACLAVSVAILLAITDNRERLALCLRRWFRLK